LLIIFLHLCQKVFLWNNAQPHQYIVNWTLVIMYILRNLHFFQLKFLLPFIKNKISIFQEPPHSTIVFVTISIILYVPTWIIVNVSWQPIYSNHILHQHTQELVEIVIVSHNASTFLWIPKFSKQHERSPCPTDNHIGNYHKG